MRILFRSALIAFLVIFMFGCKQQPMQKDSGSKVSTDTTSMSTLLLYVGTYTENDAHAENNAKGVYIYELDLNSGRLDYIATSPATTNPSFIDIHPGGNWLYTVNETGSNQGEPSGTISAFRLTGEGKALEFINSVSSRGNYPCHIQIDKTGKYVMTANYGSGTVALFTIQEDGRLGEAVSIDQHTGKGMDARQENAHAHMIITSRDNRFAYSCDLGTDHIYIYHLDTVNGKLIPAGNNYTTQPGAGPRHIALHPFKNLGYIINELNGTIECVKVDTLTGALFKFQIISTVEEGDATQASCADIHIAPSGNYLYASNRGTFNNIAMYSIDPHTGELKLIGHQSVNGKTPRNFVIDPTGTFLLVANQDTDNVVTFRIDQTSGKLIDTGVELSVPSPVCLKFYPVRHRFRS